jgi:selenocysteine lyase/cysteine desulfurase
LGCSPDEIALLGPTSLGLSLIANGIAWKRGDEVVYYRDDYPANVYPWTQLADRGVKAVSVQPDLPGVITWEVVEAALTARTRLVSLATCHFLSGYRIDVNTIGQNLRRRGILFCLDAIQTLGAFPITVDHVDFLSADSHKWLLGPAAAGIVYVKASRLEEIRPFLLGSWNVTSPRFVAQDTLTFEPGARRYEPGMLNLPGIVGMKASLDLLQTFGIDNIAFRIIDLRTVLTNVLLDCGYELYVSGRVSWGESPNRWSGIVSVTHPRRDLKVLARQLEEANINVSLRQDREGTEIIRLSPHFYNTETECERALELMKQD